MFSSLDSLQLTLRFSDFLIKFPLLQKYSPLSTAWLVYYFVVPSFRK